MPRKLLQKLRKTNRNNGKQKSLLNYSEQAFCFISKFAYCKY